MPGDGVIDCAWGGELLDSINPGAEASPFGQDEEEEWGIVILTVIPKQHMSPVQSSAVDVSTQVTAQLGCQCFFIDPVLE